MVAGRSPFTVHACGLGVYLLEAHFALVANRQAACATGATARMPASNHVTLLSGSGAYILAMVPPKRLLLPRIGDSC